MEQSQEIDKLAAALVQVQAVVEGAKKDSANPFFKSKYADLESVWGVCRQPLTENGLAVVQTNAIAPEGVIVETTLMHTSGQWIRGSLYMRPTKDDPQGIGSCITYARRYALAALVGVVQVDDDGESASGRGEGKTTQLEGPRKIERVAQPGHESGVRDALKLTDGEPETISETDRRTMFALVRKHGKTESQLRLYIKERWGLTSTSGIRPDMLGAISAWAEGKAA